MNNLRLDILLDEPFRFRERPAPISPDLRPLRRVALLLLMLEKCQGGKASHEQLHVLNWALRDTESQRALLEFLKGDTHPNKPIIRFDPTLDRATLFAEAEGFVTMELVGTKDGERIDGQWPGYRVKLLELGKQMTKELSTMADCFKPERAFLSQLNGKFTQEKVRSLFNNAKL
jgi:hypothetical protein